MPCCKDALERIAFQSQRRHAKLFISVAVKRRLQLFQSTVTDSKRVHSDEVNYIKTESLFGGENLYVVAGF